MDKISRRSKGVGYVEFYHEDSVPKAIAMTGQKLLGIPIIIHTSDAERNRVGESAVSSILCAPPPPEPTHKIFVGCLHQKVTENDLKKLFDKFGEIEEVKLHIDSTTGRSKGFGFIEYDLINTDSETLMTPLKRSKE
jgi:RNA-binding protein 39